MQPRRKRNEETKDMLFIKYEMPYLYGMGCAMKKGRLLLRVETEEIIWELFDEEEE